MFSKECAPFYIPTSSVPPCRMKVLSKRPVFSRALEKTVPRGITIQVVPGVLHTTQIFHPSHLDRSLECSVFIHMISGLSRNSIPASINNGLMFYLLSVIVSFVFYFISTITTVT